MRRTNGKRAFTLIQLLIAVVIILLVANFAVPAFEDAIGKSNMTGAAARAEQLNKATGRAILDGHTPPLGQTVDERATWLIELGYLQP